MENNKIETAEIDIFENDQSKELKLNPTNDLLKQKVIKKAEHFHFFRKYRFYFVLGIIFTLTSFFLGWIGCFGYELYNVHLNQLDINTKSISLQNIELSYKCVPALIKSSSVFCLISCSFSFISWNHHNGYPLF